MKAKYIDAEKLKAEIEARKKVHFEDYHIKKSGNPADYGAANALTQLLPFIDTLQQEQPEVDLAKEYKTWWNSISGKINVEHIMEWYMHETARHFYELGLKARKEEK